MTRQSAVLACLLACLVPARTAPASGAEEAVAGLQRRYAGVRSMRGSFRQTYRGPGIERVESGEFWLERPGLMRWQYRAPEEKLFVADGRKTFLYVPAEGQVTVSAFGRDEVRNTPLEFLLGSADIAREFDASWEGALLRLAPRAGSPDYACLLLELDRSFDVRRIVVREPTGNTSEFVFDHVQTNVRIDARLFEFKAPKGVEIIRLDNP